MRDDMAKVIVERPRIGGGRKYPRADGKRFGRRGPDALRKREGIGRPWAGESKFLNENLAPLRRYLRSQVGRPWDKVYGEICQHMNRDSAVQLHIWQHLQMEVCLDPHVIAGEVSRYGAWGHLAEFFVHPRTGLLRQTVRRGRTGNRRHHEAPQDVVAVDATHELRLIEGVWYEVTLAPLPEAARWADDVVFRKVAWPAPRCVLERFYRRPAFAVSKRQLNTKEIRRLRAHSMRR